MKTKVFVALAIGVLFGVWGAAKAHDHPPPTDCPSSCIDRQCHCVDACNKMGEAAGQECFKDCYDRKQECLSRCASMSSEDCLRTDRCAKPRG